MQILIDSLIAVNVFSHFMQLLADFPAQLMYLYVKVQSAGQRMDKYR